MSDSFWHLLHKEEAKARSVLPLYDVMMPMVVSARLTSFQARRAALPLKPRHGPAALWRFCKGRRFQRAFPACFYTCVLQELRELFNAGQSANLERQGAEVGQPWQHKMEQVTAPDELAQLHAHFNAPYKFQDTFGQNLFSGCWIAGKWASRIAGQCATPNSNSRTFLDPFLSTRTCTFLP